jgi:transcriptional regulator
VYLPKHFEETRVDVLHALVRDFPFAAVVCGADSGLVANHIPFILCSDTGEFGTLRGHIAHANPLWQLPMREANALVIFQGPASYISPNWYPGKAEEGKRVPTWGYAVAHAHGPIRFIHDRDWLLQLVSQLSETHEAAQAKPWTVNEAPSDYIERLLAAIVGIEIPIEKLIGKWKLDQNKSELDQAGMLNGLASSPQNEANHLAKLITAHKATR